MNSNAVILDGYVDEPSCLGVPPYISPYVRYVAGVLREHGYRVGYFTIDELRADPAHLQELKSAEIVVIIAGMTVPGKYLGGTPATRTEIRQIATTLTQPVTLLGGPIGFGWSPGGGRPAVREPDPGIDAFLEGEMAAALDSFLNGGEAKGNLSYPEIDRWSAMGAEIIRRHPSFPHVMCEMETARGCARSVAGGCSFCTEPFYGKPRYRDPEGVWEEVAALSRYGARHFRLGRQPDLLAYRSGGGEFPVPRPGAIEELFAGIRAAAPDLATLHIDNINPGSIARHTDAAREALGAIVRHHTPGDVAAFGMETADPAVIAANNLKASPEEVFRAIEVVNEVGGRREEGIPHLLPGLNFVAGLAGETPDTYRMNTAFLQRVLEAGLLIRRVNIRQLMPFEGTRAAGNNTLGMHDREFRHFKERVRREFDLPMLKRVYPAGTVLRSVIIEEEGSLSLGRQMGSYPILAGIPLRLERGAVIDAAVVDWGMRSVTALPVPVAINTLPVSALRWIPGIGKKRAGAIAARRPIRDERELRKIAGETPLDGLFVF